MKYTEMNVKDEYSRQFLNQYQTLLFSDEVRSGTPSEKAGVFRRLMGQLHLIQEQGR